MLETSVAIRMEQNHNQHDLRYRHFAITMVVSLGLSVLCIWEKSAKISSKIHPI